MGLGLSIKYNIILIIYYIINILLYWKEEIKVFGYI